MIIFVIILGVLLFSFGAIIMLTTITPTSWDASWPEIKAAFRATASKPRFQASLACVVIGFLMMSPIFLLIMP